MSALYRGICVAVCTLVVGYLFVMWPLLLIFVLLVAAVALFEVCVDFGTKWFNTTWLGQRVAVQRSAYKLERLERRTPRGM